MRAETNSLSVWLVQYHSCAGSFHHCVVPLPLGGRLRDLAFACALGGCAAVCVCLRTTDGRPCGSNMVRQSVTKQTSVRIQGWWSLNSIGSRRRQRTQLYQRCPQTNERGRNVPIPAQSLFALKVFGVWGLFSKSPHEKTAPPRKSPHEKPASPKPACRVFVCTWGWG